MIVESIIPKEFFYQCGAVMEGGHFVLTPSGLHSSVYFSEREALSYITKAYQFCHKIAEGFAADDVQVVICPEERGYRNIVALWTAQNMSNITNRKVVGIKVSDDLAGKRVLVVDGILNTGDTARKVAAAVQKIGGNVVGVGALWNRGGITPQAMDVPKIHALVDEKLEAWNEEDCPLCKAEMPITDVSWGQLRKHKQTGR
jgi:orotate phosphoribosyltransferase